MNITNKADKAVIEIFGGIGEDWFGEGNTLQSVNNQIKNITASEIEVIISSLGGSVNHALAIHDILRIHPAKITTNIIGVTASSGTLVSSAGDVRKMSKNALFLVHEPEGEAQGKANDLRRVADAIDKHEERIIGIYNPITNISKSKIKSLMKEEKFIDAKEAKEYGFITDIYEPIDAAASISKEKKTQILNDLKTKQAEMELKQELSDLKKSFTDFKNQILDSFKKTDKPEDFETIVNDKLSLMESNIETLTGENATLNKSIVDFTENLATEKAEHETVKAKLVTVKAEKETLETKLGLIEATKTGLDQTADPVIDPEKIVNTALGTNISDMLTEEQRETLKINKKDK